VKWDYIKADEEGIKAFQVQPNNPLLLAGLVEWALKRNYLDKAMTFLDKIKSPSQSVKVFILSGDKEKALDSIASYLKADFDKIKGPQKVHVMERASKTAKRWSAYGLIGFDRLLFEGPSHPTSIWQAGESPRPGS
jgi:hypothetical protein